ncbi:diamine acetyltransferase 1 isoform X3 [Nerophis ophidion]|uniref:diamine acetyltransferase 1 isoform X3 n=1 Tax=Nerophis ophidion TaxID=159077 RepID=UPI002ADF2D70|nr:diamine acetyltransferase 1 isoform X3 [Nerophis ophidion]
MDFSIRAAIVEDCKDVARMNLDLATYEKVPEQVTVTQKDLEQDGFSKNPFFQCLIAEVPQQHKSKDGYTLIGFALYFYSYSAWRGKSIYLEDLYVMPEFRGQGVGKALLSKVAQCDVLTVAAGFSCRLPHAQLHRAARQPVVCGLLPAARRLRHDV